MANTHLIYDEKLKDTIMDSILANDVRNALQADMYRLDWTQCNSANCYSCPTDVIVGNDEFPVIAFRSYSTIVAFYFQGYIYEIGKYSQTTSSQIGRYFRNKVLRNHVILGKIYYNKLS